ncbi:MAG: methyl-accepting chemotaxis protein [Oceanospirillaceae bacterium]|nr:methyl-accepting chemotaxis protein [Oceanospirillaceae bacterium]
MNKLSIQQRFAIWAGVSLFAVVLGSTAVGIWQFSETKDELAVQSEQTINAMVEDYLEAISQEITLSMAGSLAEGLDKAESLASSMAVLSRYDVDEKRSLALDALAELLADNPDFLGTYVNFEPDTFNRNDALFADTQGSDSDGRFVPYVTRQSPDSVLVENLEGYLDQTVDDNGVRAGEYYLCSKDSGRSCIIDPYLYPIDGVETLLTSLVAPIKSQGRFIGIAGVDISAAFIQKLTVTSAADLYQGNSEIILVSPRGIVSGHSGDAGLVGQNVSALSTSVGASIEQSRNSGLVKVSIKEKRVEVVTPFTVSDLPDTWALVMSVPTDLVMRAVDEQNELLDTAQTSFFGLMLLAGLILVAAGIVVIWLVSRSTIRPLVNMTTLVSSIAEGEGDLTRTIDVTRQDETGELAGHLNTFIGNLRKMIGEMVQVGAQVSQLSQRSNSICGSTAAQISEQQILIDQVVTAITEMSATAQEVAGSASNVADAASKADDAAERGNEVMQSTAASIGKVAKSSEQAKEAMTELKRNSEDIVGILTVIQGIAEQTNLLALNAAIEAARAGEQGRGFAVVADEVRALARRTQDATGDIQAKLDALQKGSHQAEGLMTESVEMVGATVEQANRSEAALSEIKQAIQKIREMTFQIATATEEQSAVCEDVTRNITDISQVAVETAEGAERLSSVGTEFERAAGTLNKRLSTFKV